MYEFKGEQSEWETSIEKFVNFINGEYKKFESFPIPGFRRIQKRD